MKLIDADELLKHIDYNIEKIGMGRNSDYIRGMQVVRLMVEDAVEVSGEITNEQAIDHLHKTDWLQAHDCLTAEGDLTAIINRIMEKGDKSISINIYPYKEEPDDK